MLTNIYHCIPEVKYKFAQRGLSYLRATIVHSDLGTQRYAYTTVSRYVLATARPDHSNDHVANCATAIDTLPLCYYESRLVIAE